MADELRSPEIAAWLNTDEGRDWARNTMRGIGGRQAGRDGAFGTLLPPEHPYVCGVACYMKNAYRPRSEAWLYEMEEYPGTHIMYEPDKIPQGMSCPA